MTQTQQVYDFLQQWPGPAADRALVLAMRHVEPPYDMVIMEALLERGRTEPLGELVKHYHDLSPECQAMMLGEAGKLFGGLRLVVGDETPQTRMNILDIIQRTQYRRLLDVVLILLRDRRHGISQRAGEVLVGLVADFPRPQLCPASEPLPQYTDGDVVRSVLKAAVANSRIYRRPEMVLAAMHVALADDQDFWQDRLEIYHPVHRMIGSLMMKSPRPSLAAFYLSALKRPGLRTLAARALATYVQPEMIGALARAYAVMADMDITAGLCRVRQPRWLSPKLMETLAITEDDRGALMRLLNLVEAPIEQKAACLMPLLPQASEAILDQAMTLVADWPAPAAVGVLENIVCGPRETPALRALVAIMRNHAVQARRILARQLNSPHPPVRDLARRYFRQQAFNCYWQHFDYLTLAQRRSAGQVIFKIDPEAPRRWRQYARHVSTEHRLRAARVAALLEGRECFTRELWRMTRDPDSKVRSCAVRALTKAAGQVEQTNQLLLAALDDSDPRVRANAVEALDERNVTAACGRFQQMMVHEHNRVRANAIKALLSRRVDTARQAVARMLHDPRRRHRLSARWVVRQFAAPVTLVAKHGDHERTQDHADTLVSV